MKIQTLSLDFRITVRNLGTPNPEGKHPERSGTSRPSPYLHFGHIGPLTIVHAVQAASARLNKGTA